MLLSANIVAELITKLPKAGGTYVPVRAAFGESMGCSVVGLIVGVKAVAFLAELIRVSEVAAQSRAETLG